VHRKGLDVAIFLITAVKILKLFAIRHGVS
jgi:hypothetical protein